MIKIQTNPPVVCSVEELPEVVRKVFRGYIGAISRYPTTRNGVFYYGETNYFVSLTTPNYGESYRAWLRVGKFAGQDDKWFVAVFERILAEASSRDEAMAFASAINGIQGDDDDE